MQDQLHLSRLQLAERLIIKAECAPVQLLGKWLAGSWLLLLPVVLCCVVLCCVQHQP
jgi:hypothetical protein